MVDAVNLVGSRRWCSWSPHRLLLCVLVVITVLFVSYVDVSEMWPNLSPRRLTKQNTTTQIKEEGNPEPKSPAPMYQILTNHSPQGLAEHDETTQIRGEDNPEPQSPAPTESAVSPYWVKYPYKYRFTIDEPNKCEQQKPFLVIMVPVAPHNRKHRDIIRSTWGSVSLVLDKVIQLFFMLGQHSGEGADRIQEQLLEENKEHGDLIQGDFIDSYNNLTIKTMMMLEWLDLHCSSTSYVIKIDSDMFLNIQKLISMLLYAPNTNYVTGKIWKRPLVDRDPESKWYMPKSEYPDDFYPDYPNGVAYVFSMDMAKKLLEASRHVRALYIEDVYVGMCMQHLKISFTEPPVQGFFLQHTPYIYCVLSKLIAVPSDDLVQVWKHFIKNKHSPIALRQQRQ